MKALLVAAILTVGVIQVDYPKINPPSVWRVQNWSPFGEGSCVHASMYTVLHWQGQHAMAEWWKQSYHSGDIPERLEEKLNYAKLRYAETRTGDVRFLEWAMRTRRACAVCVQGGRHMVTLVHLDDKWAGILDSNSPQQIKWLSRNAFLDDWTTTDFKWAVTVIYTPPPPPPRRK